VLKDLLPPRAGASLGRSRTFPFRVYHPFLVVPAPEERRHMELTLFFLQVSSIHFFLSPFLRRFHLISASHLDCSRVPLSDCGLVPKFFG